MKTPTLLFLMLFAAPSFAQEPIQLSKSVHSPRDVATQDRLDRVQMATARIRQGGGIGTGTVFREDRSYYYILTNSHVVGNGRGISADFNVVTEKGMFSSSAIACDLVSKTRLTRTAGLDLAIVRVAKSRLNGVSLPVIPLTKKSRTTGLFLSVTTGCQAGEKPSTQVVRILRHKQGTVDYLPTSRPGRSGSALVDRDAKEILFVCAWMSGPEFNSYGIAMNAEVINPWVDSVFAGRVQEVTEIVLDLPASAVRIPKADASQVPVSNQQCNPNNPFCRPQQQAPPREEQPEPDQGGNPFTSPNLPDPPKEDQAEPKYESEFARIDSKQNALNSKIVKVLDNQDKLLRQTACEDEERKGFFQRLLGGQRKIEEKQQEIEEKVAKGGWEPGDMIRGLSGAINELPLIKEIRATIRWFVLGLMLFGIHYFAAMFFGVDWIGRMIAYVWNAVRQTISRVRNPKVNNTVATKEQLQELLNQLNQNKDV